jgi:FtsH-binding integral membrane protein
MYLFLTNFVSLFCDTILTLCIIHEASANNPTSFKRQKRWQPSAFAVLINDKQLLPLDSVWTAPQRVRVLSFARVPESSMQCIMRSYATNHLPQILLPHIVRPKVWGTNMVGLLFAIYYLTTFVRHSPKSAPSLPGSVKQHVTATLVLMATAVALVYSPMNDPAKIVGNMAVALCISMFGSPLAALKTVLQTKSARSIPLPFTLATVLNCLLWSITGLFQMRDANIYVPNLIGLAFGVAQIVLKLIFGDAAPEKGMPQML